MHPLLGILRIGIRQGLLAREDADTHDPGRGHLMPQGRPGAPAVYGDFRAEVGWEVVWVGGLSEVGTLVLVC